MAIIDPGTRIGFLSSIVQRSSALGVPTWSWPAIALAKQEIDEVNLMNARFSVFPPPWLIPAAIPGPRPIPEPGPGPIPEPTPPEKPAKPDPHPIPEPSPGPIPEPTPPEAPAKPGPHPIPEPGPGPIPEQSLL